MPDGPSFKRRQFEIVDKNNSSRRFPGDFSIEPSAGAGAAATPGPASPITEPPPADKPKLDDVETEDLRQTFIARLNEILDLVGAHETASMASTASPALKTILAAWRDDTIGSLARKHDAIPSLRQQAEYFVEGTQLPVLLNNLQYIKGGYETRSRLMDQRPFDVRPVMGQDNLLSDLDIVLTPFAPPLRSADPRMKLYLSIAVTRSIIKAVCGHDDGKKKDLHRYLDKLAGIATQGLIGFQTEVATGLNEELRANFTTEQSGDVKNGYIKRLGTAALAAVSVILLAAIGVRYGFGASAFGGFAVRFLTAATGAAVGMWLSFSIRRVDFEFIELAVIEKDLLIPAFRTLFVLGLTLAVSLLFATGAINLEIGQLHTNVFLVPDAAEQLRALKLDTAKGLDADQMKALTELLDKAKFAATFSTGALLTSLLIGILCGLSERGLANAMSARAATFAAGIGGTTTATGKA